MANILGLSAYYHDSAAAIVVGGRLVAAAQEERFTRLKADASFPQNATAACLEIAGLSLDDIDAVAFYELPLLKFDRLIETFLAGAPRGFQPFRASMPSWLSTKLRVRDQIRGLFAGSRQPSLHHCPHHLSHAASAFYPSPFESAAVLTVDGVGEWATASIAHGTGNRLQPLVEQRFPHSLGLLYSAVTSYCGFEINSGEYKLMGLAATGQPRWLGAMLRDIAHVADDGSIELDQRYFDYCHGMRMTSSRFHQYFDRGPRTVEQPLSQLDCDLASSVQAIVELAMTRMARHACRLTGERKLCLAGGVALNCVAIGRLVDDGTVDEAWVQPAAGDAGAAAGAAFWLSHERLNIDRRCTRYDQFSGAFLGPHYSDKEVRSALDHAGLLYRQLSEDDSICRETARLLADGAVVGWFQGEMEFGPRALGHRSILADPRDASMKHRVNELVKHREPFRPFAPAILQAAAADFFVSSGASIDEPYMTRTFQVRQPAVIPAVTHLDGTARVQTVDRARNPKFASLLETFHELTGVPVLLNTSFNDRDEPIVRSPDDAIAAFLSTNLDALAIENYLVLKQPLPARHPRAAAAVNVSLSQCLATAAEFRDRLTYPLRWTGSIVTLAIVYYLVLSPIGIGRRWRGHRPLDQLGWLPFTFPLTDLCQEPQSARGSWWRELVQFLREEKKWWLIPIALSLAVVAIAASVGGSVAPWIYAIW